MEFFMGNVISVSYEEMKQCVQLAIPINSTNFSKSGKVSIVSISTHAVQAEVKFLGQIYATKFSFMMLMHAFSFSAAIYD